MFNQNYVLDSTNLYGSMTIVISFEGNSVYVSTWSIGFETDEYFVTHTKRFEITKMKDALNCAIDHYYGLIEQIA